MNIVVEKLTHEHIEPYLQKFPAVMQSLQVQSCASERLYLEQVIQDVQLAPFFYVIKDADTQILMGAIQIRPRESSRGQLYMWLHPDFWGKGIIQQALQIVAADYFAATDATYFDATVHVTNMRSYKALKKAGFADIGMQEGAWGQQFLVVLRKK